MEGAALGRAGTRLVSPGTRIKVEDGLVRVDGIDPLSLVFTIPEAVLPLARVGAQYELEVAAFPNRRFPGEIRFIAPSVDSATRRILIKGRVPNPDGTLLPGMFARVKANLGQREAVLVPEEALGSDQGQRYVFVLNESNEVVYRPVKLGPQVERLRVIEEGVTASDRVIVSGLKRVRAGIKVLPKDALAVKPTT